MRRFHLQGPNDPFTLLKIIQVFREIPVDDRLEILCDTSEILDELFKVLPEGSYQVEPSRGEGAGPPRGIVLCKIAFISDRPPAGGCRCP